MAAPKIKSAGTILKNVSSYAARLDNDNWRDFSREMRRTKGNFCQCCRMGDKVTQVHHVAYEMGREPWEYEADEVVILCADCHHRLHAQLNAFRRHVFQHLTPTAFQVLNGALKVGLTQYDPLTFVHALAEFASTPRMVANFAAAWSKEPNDKGN